MRVMCGLTAEHYCHASPCEGTAKVLIKKPWQEVGGWVSTRLSECLHLCVCVCVCVKSFLSGHCCCHYSTLKWTVSCHRVHDRYRIMNKNFIYLSTRINIKTCISGISWPNIRKMQTQTLSWTQTGISILNKIRSNHEGTLYTSVSYSTVPASINMCKCTLTITSRGLDTRRGSIPIVCAKTNSSNGKRVGNFWAGEACVAVL